jgi:hypothetical protein
MALCRATGSVCHSAAFQMNYSFSQLTSEARFLNFIRAMSVAVLVERPPASSPLSFVAWPQSFEKPCCARRRAASLIDAPSQTC